MKKLFVGLKRVPQPEVLGPILEGPLFDLVGLVDRTSVVLSLRAGFRKRPV